MNPTVKKWGLLFIRAFLTLAFLGAGFAKLSGQAMMIDTFETIGVGQWFRYLTGVIEVAGGVGLWIKGFEGWSAAVLVATMVGAVLAHIFVLGPPMTPAMFLGLLSLFVLWAHRHQVPIVKNF